MEDNNKRPILGGIFGTRTEVDSEGNVIQKDDFHLRLYWELFEPNLQKEALKGNAFKVFLFIAMHLDKNGEGWPSQRRIAKKLGINKDTVGTAIERLEKYGLIEASQSRKPDGTWANTVYKLRLTPEIVDKETKKAASEKTGHGTKPHKTEDFTVSEKTGDGKSGPGFFGHKEDTNSKKDNNVKAVVAFYQEEFKKMFNAKLSKKDAESFTLEAKKNGKDLIDYIHYVKDQSAKKEIGNPVGYLRNAVRENWDVPNIAELEQAAAKEEAKKAAVKEEYADAAMEALVAAGINPKEVGY